MPACPVRKVGSKCFLFRLFDFHVPSMKICSIVPQYNPSSLATFHLLRNLPIFHRMVISKCLFNTLDNCSKGVQMIFNETSVLQFLTHMLLANLANTKCWKRLKNDLNPETWALIWEYSARAIQWISTWQGLDGFQKSLRPCALDESSISIG